MIETFLKKLPLVRPNLHQKMLSLTRDYLIKPQVWILALATKTTTISLISLCLLIELQLLSTRMSRKWKMTNKVRKMLSRSLARNPRGALKAQTTARGREPNQWSLKRNRWPRMQLLVTKRVQLRRTKGTKEEEWTDSVYVN